MDKGSNPTETIEPFAMTCDDCGAEFMSNDEGSGSLCTDCSRKAYAELSTEERIRMVLEDTDPTDTSDAALALVRIDAILSVAMNRDSAILPEAVAGLGLIDEANAAWAREQRG